MHVFTPIGYWWNCGNFQNPGILNSPRNMLPYPLKRFIQGPNLQDQFKSVSSNVVQSSNERATLLGEEVKGFYEEVISSSSSTPLPLKSSEKITLATHQTSTPASALIPTLSLNKLMKLCEEDDSDQLEDYLKAKTDLKIDEVDDFGWSLLMVASTAGSSECAALLLKHGASLHLTDKKGATALEHARKRRQWEVVRLLEEWGQRLKHEENDKDECYPVELEDDQEIFCSACDKHFQNQSIHLRSIAHLLSAGSMGDGRSGKVHYGIPQTNVGFQMMLRSGWNSKEGLGSEGNKGIKFPVKTILKRGREGVGSAKDKGKARVTHFRPFDIAAVMGPRDRVERGATLERKAEAKQRVREKRKEINFRRELNS